jgi:uncharacterized protein with ParB-like and HNH nuclease domain
MDAATTVKRMLYGNKIRVPNYQRAYAWDTPSSASDTKTQTDVFLEDLENYINSGVTTPYYFGHFLFAEKADDSFDVIDGQQRLTTIIIFLSALFAKIKLIRSLTDDETGCFENMIMRGKNYAFSTVEYDDQFFKDYVIDQSQTSKNDIKTNSAKRIVAAFDFFVKRLAEKTDEYLDKMLQAIMKSTCSTHLVKDESEAIQMFIFQNDRGKKPTNLEIIKAQFMYIIHLKGGNNTTGLLTVIKNRFEEIYKSISAIEHHMDEDSVLLYTLRVYYNSLWESNSLEKINSELNGENPIQFISDFSQCLQNSFTALKSFFGKDEKECFEIHSFITLGRLAEILPFIIKLYNYGLLKDDVRRFCSAAESLILRHRLIHTQAYIGSRLNNVYQKFTKQNNDINPVIKRITWMKTVKDWWWAFWNNEHLEENINGWIDPRTAKFLLWKYENYLVSQGPGGYKPKRFNDIIESPELEHIAPQTPTNGEPVSAGYCEYDEEFMNEYINCLGNYLLISKVHNASIGNKPFVEKWASYTHLSQQDEVHNMTNDKQVWNKEKINERHDKIVGFILENL